jgi:hypothetical protein
VSALLRWRSPGHRRGRSRSSKSVPRRDGRYPPLASGNQPQRPNPSGGWGAVGTRVMRRVRLVSPWVRVKTFSPHGQGQRGGKVAVGAAGSDRRAVDQHRCVGIPSADEEDAISAGGVVSGGIHHLQVGGGGGGVEGGRWEKLVPGLGPWRCWARRGNPYLLWSGACLPQSPSANPPSPLLFRWLPYVGLTGPPDTAPGSSRNRARSKLYLTV